MPYVKRYAVNKESISVEKRRNFEYVDSLFFGLVKTWKKDGAWASTRAGMRKKIRIQCNA
jgi:hypothetical protein